MDYVLKDDDGSVIDQSPDGQPLAYLHGHGNIIAGLERQLEGSAPGDAKSVSVPPAEAYGEYDPKLKQQVDRSLFPEVPIEPGMQFRAGTPEGDRVVRISEVGDGYVVVDANHELAGKTLHFEVKVKEVREATPHELEHGHAHGAGGVHH